MADDSAVTAGIAAPAADPEFSLTASESELLEEFGVLLAAEYNYETF